MTDSMKFGPGWLRNMSTDNTNPSVLTGVSSGSSNTNSSSSANSTNDGNSQHSTFGGLMSNVGPSSFVSATRNTFPEFRYGREEMLSLFDKLCYVPEILPSFKKIFVEKVQYPLALTPSTDEELLPQAPSVPTQRPSWMQRSPVGFSSSIRGRGGSVDRGRMRGKPTYHPMYQRPTALFGDDDLRSVPAMKAERGWPERNGSGDSISGIAGTVPGSIGLSSDWNGTPTSSPRKEFSSHPRNMENWRRSRNEDGSGEAAASGLNSTDGWRGGSSNTTNNFNSTHRWGRSTSWRDEDISAAGVPENSYGAGSCITMQRSYSTITTVNERGGAYNNGGNSVLKSTQNSSPYIGTVSGQTAGRQLNSLNAGSVRNNQWNSASGMNTSGGSVPEMEDNLPEWAMENPSDSGGTFDASGAFHGSIDDEESNFIEKFGKDQLLQRKKSTSSTDSSIQNIDIKNCEENSEHAATRASTSLESESKNNISDSSEHSATGTPTDNISIQKELQQESFPPSTLSKATEDELKPELSKKTPTEDLGSNKVIQSHIEQQSSESNVSKKISGVTAKTDRQHTLDTSTLNANYYSNRSSPPEKLVPKSVINNSGVHHDLSDRMREVADDMIEKLIMDDDTVNIGVSSSGTGTKDNIPVSSAISANIVTTNSPGNNLCGSNNYVVPSVAALMKQAAPHQPIQVPVSVSPILTATLNEAGAAHTGLQLYGGVVADHSALQHHHLQQQQLAPSTSNITATGRLTHTMNSTVTNSTDLWYYRDPQSKVQGPFTAIEMTEWYRAGYFNENLYVRRLCDTHFRSLGELIKLCNDNMPFTHSHLIPMSLDNIHISNSVSRQSPQKPHFSLKQQHPPNEQREDLKGSDFISGSAKNRMNPLDMSQVYFQMMHHQEMVLINELSKSECFQRLTQTEKEAIIRQKLQMHNLPDYTNNVSGLGAPLSSLNPATGNRIYDILAECSKKEQHLFTNSASSVSANNIHPPQTNPFIEPDNFILNSQHPLQTPFTDVPFGTVLPGTDPTTANKIGRGDDSAGNDVLNSLNLRMFLPGGSGNSPQMSHLKSQDYVTTPNTNEFLGEQPMLGASGAPALLQNNTIVHPWLPQIGNNGTGISHQSSLVNLQQASQQNTAPAQNHQWTSGLLVGMPMTGMNSAQLSNTVSITARNVTSLQQQPHHQKTMPSSMWELPSSECTQGEQQDQQPLNQQQQHNPSNIKFDEKQKSTNAIRKQVNHPLQKQHLENDVTTPVTRKQPLMSTVNQKQNQIETIIAPPSAASTTQSHKDETTEKYQTVGGKRTNKQQTATNKSGKDENTCSRKNEEERRREQAEDKRRQREEKKRQQMEEEKRRQQQVEEERRRQILEEKERQQQIQAQRRKAMLGNTSGAVAGGSTINKQFKDQQRIQSSVAPWSTQTTTAASKSGPCLAEIQKAERRERRADQQRQLELLERQMRANAAAAAEASDSILKWNPSPVAVKSLAEIQAEEAKRLANELELQRRKEQEQQQAGSVAIGGSNLTASSANISAIWNGTKAWGTNISAGFWEEPVKFSAAVAGNSLNNGITAAAVVAANLSGNNVNSLSNNNNNSKLSEQQKLHSSAGVTSNSGQQQQNSANVASRNLRKSQTVSVMQNADPHSGKNGKSNNQQQANTGKTAGVSNKSLQQQKTGGNGDGNDKKNNLKNTNNITNTSANSNTAGGNKLDDYENEFTTWCTKCLNNMNTKIDVPTFVIFLQDLESPFEVKDYVRMYLGDNKEYTEFAKQFLERRSKYKSLQRAQNAHNDDMCKPAPAITPSGNDNSDNKGKQKKIKKGKMTKLDARILGFSVTAAEGRTNVGDRAYVDAP